MEWDRLSMVSEELAVLVVDMQHDFLEEGAPCEIPEGRKVVPRIKQLLDKARALGIPIIHVCTIHRRDGSDVPRFTTTPQIKMGLREGSRGAEIVGPLRPQAGDYQVIKKRYSGFYQTDLELLLRRLNVGNLIVTGVATNYCVSSTVRDAADRDLMCYVPSECVATRTEKEQKVSLSDINVGFGKVVSLAEAITMMEVSAKRTELEAAPLNSQGIVG